MDWELSYQKNETPWDRGEPAPPLVEYLESNSIRGRVLVPGCGLGYDVRYIAARGCDTVGVDVSSTALERAKAFPNPPQGMVSYERLDLLDPNNGLSDEDFDYVFEHTCFCAIDPSLRARYVDTVGRLLKPSGYLLAIMFTHLEEPGGPPFPTSTAEVVGLFTPKFKIERQWRPSKVFEGRENEESMYLMKRR